jgi:flavodoxin
MKHALVVYESTFGNTKEIAEAVAGGLRLGRQLSQACGTVTVTQISEESSVRRLHRLAAR